MFFHTINSIIGEKLLDEKKLKLIFEINIQNKLIVIKATLNYLDGQQSAS